MFGNVPLLLIVPLVLIVLIILIAIIVIIRDRLAMKDLAIPTFDNLGKEAVKEENKPIKKDKEAITQTPSTSKHEEIDHYSKIDHLKNRLDTMDIKTAYEEFIKIVRKFFADHLNLNYEFTYEELEKELRKKDSKISISPDTLSKTHYSPHPISKEVLIEMIEEFKNIIKKINPQPAPNLSLNNNLKKIKKLLTKGEKIPKKDSNKAIEIYRKIYHLYYQLPTAGKLKLHNSIIEFYNSITSS